MAAVVEAPRAPAQPPHAAPCERGRSAAVADAAHRQLGQGQTGVVDGELPHLQLRAISNAAPADEFW